MTLTVSQVFDLPRREDITALGFVVRLSDDDEDAAFRRLVDDYVVTPTVAQELPVILKSMRHTYKARGDLGRFVHGSFGSGKSHFLTYLGLLLENRDVAWSKSDPAVRALADEHRGWLGEACLLVVRLHMLTAASGHETGFDRAIYEAVSEALRRRGKAPFEFLHVDGVLAEARREAELYGAQFWKRLEEGGVVGSRAEFDAMASGSADEREAVARAYLAWKGRDAASAGVDPRWGDGLRRLAEHVKAQGYGGLVLLVDEFLLWLREKSGPDFERAINQLNVIVDHADGARAVPLFVFVARQRNIEEFFPDMVEERQLHEHLGHHAKRFEVTNLEDVELRHVCRGRVLRRRPEHAADVQRVVDALARDHEKVLPAILHGAEIGYLRDVYPFHPALIEMLIDVSALMQRDRTALRLLYELLLLHHPELPLGKLLPVGCAFDAIFPPAGVEGSKRVEDLRAIHRTYYQRFRPAIDRMLRDAKAAGSDFDEKRRGELDAMVKTALLAEVSPRLRGSSMNVERLVRLNDAEVTGETDRSKFNRVYQDLLELSRIASDLQLSGTGKSATVSVVLQNVNFSEMLGRARDRVAGQKQPLLTAFYKVLLPALGLKRELVPGEIEIEWRETRRRGSIDVTNVRTLANAEFKRAAHHEFRILIDYPWDEPGYSVDDDVARVADVRKRDGTGMTICWLPRHLTPSELGFVQDIAALDELLGPAQDELLRDLAPHERSMVVDQAQNQSQNLQKSLTQKLGEVYRDHGQISAMIGGVEARVPGGELEYILHERLGQMLLDRQFPSHPSFTLEPRPDRLRVLCEWLSRAAEKPDQTEAFSDDESRVLQGLGVPLELVQSGQTRASLRLDTRYIKTVRDAVKDGSAMWDPIDRRLQETYALQPAVRNMFLLFLCRLESFRTVNAASGEPVEVPLDSKPHTTVKLLRAPLIDLASWSRAREVGPQVLKAQAPSGARTLSEQDRYVALLCELASQKRSDLEGVHERLVKLGAGGGRRVADLKIAIARLAPLAGKPADSCATLQKFLAAWPDDAGDPIRLVVARIATMKEALGKLDDTARLTLQHAVKGPHAAEVDAHVRALHELLSAGEQERALSVNAIDAWNETARDLLARILQRPVTPPPPPPQPPPPPGVPVPLFQAEVVRTRDAPALRALADRIVARLGDLADEEVEIDVLFRPRGRS
ncbi:hypothetical protein BE20_13430 [Sorangium cellulosum]|uniref:Phage resistance protein n=1 Tax=Sorangium cellulosum TaxID=56 RepID=A0A150SHG5_SORCE|nr:hypothetical protein BE18_13765 [Sorangium cellulosum]KYF91859.1 hypothetical protein BE20_13430 [Sorangium cellulosum]